MNIFQKSYLVMVFISKQHDIIYAGKLIIFFAWHFFIRTHRL